MTTEIKNDTFVYYSLNNFKICLNNNEKIEIPNELKNCFRDPITLEIMKYPVYIPLSGKIYDKIEIKKWFSQSNIDPLTGVELNFNEFKIIPVLNYFLALLCIEEINNKLYFHPPTGNIFDLLVIANNIFKNYKISKISTTYSLYKDTKGNYRKAHFVNNNLPDEDKYSLNLENYIPNIELDEIIPQANYYCKNQKNVIPNNNVDCNFTKTVFIKPITIYDILCVCPVSKRSLLGKCCISDYGIFTHLNISNKLFSTTKGNNTLSVFYRNFQSEKTMNILNYELCNILRFDTTDDNIFEIVENGKQTEQINYDDVKSCLTINTLEIIYESLSNLENIFSSKTNLNLYGEDFYLSYKNTHQVMHEFYVKNYGQIITKLPNKLNALINEKTFDFKLNANDKIYHKKKIFDFPCALENTTYGDCLSFLQIKNQNYKKKKLKSFYFIGTTFIDTLFIYCDFSVCVFIGAVFIRSGFIECKFNECSLYKLNNFPTQNCHVDTKTAKTLPPLPEELNSRNKFPI
jgi:uncharacterized protein YjbI with pentapeptide repeats